MKNKTIPRKILKTELSFAMQMIDKQNYGYAKQLISQVLSRINFYDMKIKSTQGQSQ